MADTHAAKLLFAMTPWSSKLGRAPVVAEPCAGISAFREWMHEAGLVYRPCTAMDSDLNLVPFWRTLRNQGMQDSEQIKLGAQEGDIQRRGLLQSMSDAEGLIAGPPCQPFASTGLRQGSQDEQGRTDVFESTVDMICELGSRGSLLWFVVENSTRLGDVTHAVFLNEMLLRLETCLPFFLVDTLKLDAAEFLPIRRGRFFIRGLRRDCLPDPMQANLPAPLCCSDLLLCVALEKILEPDLPATSEESLCPGHMANLALYKQLLTKAIEEFTGSGQALPSRTVVLELDRNPLKTFGGMWGWGKIPSLRTSGPPLFLLSCEDLSEPWQEMRLHRWLTIPERFRALGQRGTLAKHFCKREPCHSCDWKCSFASAASSSGQPIGASSRGERGFDKICKMSSRKCGHPCPHQASRNLGQPRRSRAQRRLWEAGQPKASQKGSSPSRHSFFFQKKLLRRLSLHLKRKPQQLESQSPKRRKPPRLGSHRLQLKRKQPRLGSDRLQL